MVTPVAEAFDRRRPPCAPCRYPSAKSLAPITTSPSLDIDRFDPVTSLCGLDQLSGRPLRLFGVGKCLRHRVDGRRWSRACPTTWCLAARAPIAVAGDPRLVFALRVSNARWLTSPAAGASRSSTACTRAGVIDVQPAARRQSYCSADVARFAVPVAKSTSSTRSSVPSSSLRTTGPVGLGGPARVPILPSQRRRRPSDR